MFIVHFISEPILLSGTTRRESCAGAASAVGDDDGGAASEQLAAGTREPACRAWEVSKPASKPPRLPSSPCVPYTHTRPKCVCPLHSSSLRASRSTAAPSYAFYRRRRLCSARPFPSAACPQLTGAPARKVF